MSSTANTPINAGLGISEDDFCLLLDQWDAVSQAIDRAVTALPSDVTAAAENLESRRQDMRDLINVITRRSGV